MRILVCDDDQERADETLGAVRAGWTAAGLAGADLVLEPLVESALGEQLKLLFENVRIAMGDRQGAFQPTGFDGRDLVIIDNNLAHLDLGGVRHTAETVAGFIRAFTTTGYIVSLNRSPAVDFDLRTLVGDASTIADQSLNTDHLSIAALWRRGAEGDFRPWYWPELSSAPGRRAAQIAEIINLLDEDVLKYFGFDDVSIEALSRDALGALSGNASAQDAAKGEARITFREFFKQSTRSVPASSDRDFVAKHNQTVARVVAAELEMWLRRHVIAPQDVLVDLPHLLGRMPYILGDQASQLATWNAAVDNRAEPYGLSQPLFDQHLKNLLWAYPKWVDAVIFYWPALNTDEDLSARFFTSPSWGDFVFCEDTSRFLERKPADETPVPQEFAAEFEGSWNRRFIAKVTGKKYAPLSRLAI
jgi:hypothetical protein